MKISSRFREYELFIEQKKEFFYRLFHMKNAEFVIDKNVYVLYGGLFAEADREHLYLVEAAEEAKVMETVLDICGQITKISAKRNAVLVSVGGGIIQDLTGFAANIIYRGIQWIYVPTTLLAACDSCIGGKTSLNYKGYKNLLGTFYPPSEIHICSEMFATLSERDFKSGLGEVVKFNIMSGIAGLENMERDITKLFRREPGTVDKYIRSSLEYKKQFIESDEFDRGERIKLNFAHTFGHAVETVSLYEIPHGTAVAIGMIMANHISFCRGYLSADIVKRTEKILLEIIDIDAGLLDQSADCYLAAVRKDKKQTGDFITAVLITDYQDTAELTVVHDVQEHEIRNAIQYFITQYREKR